MLTPPHRYERFRALLHACGHSRAGCWIRAGACGACVVPDARLRVQRARAAFRGRPPTPCAPSLCTLGTAARTPLTARWQVISDAPFGPSFDHEIVTQQQLSVTAPVSLFCTAQVIWLNGQELVRGGERPRVAVSFEQAPHAAAVMLLSVVVIKSRSPPHLPLHRLSSQRQATVARHASPLRTPTQLGRPYHPTAGGHLLNQSRSRHRLRRHAHLVPSSKLHRRATPSLQR